MEIDALKTLCCKGEFKRIGRASYICSLCNKDVSIEFALLMEVILEDEERPDAR